MQMADSKSEVLDWRMNKRLVVLSFATFGTLFLVSPAKAQRHGAFSSARGSRGFVHLRRSGRFFPGSAFGPYFYSDYDSEPWISEESPPEIIELTTPSASPAPERNPPQSLMLELQGDHWVRITNNGQSQAEEQSDQQESERTSSLPTAVLPAAPRRTGAAEPPNELPPAVLVFRDGHEEEMRKYAIVGPIIYAGGDYWTSGSWTRKIQIVELDVPATLRLNQERGAKFSLPSGPNEVMIRP
jgi:hypothetical protein